MTNSLRYKRCSLKQFKIGEFMKIIKTMMATAVVLLATGCASEPKNEEFKAGIADCAVMCKANPEVKEYSQSVGGGFILLFFGGEGKKCACNR